MRRMLCTLILSVGLLLGGGCTLLEGVTSNVVGWDVSACVSGFDTCWELFWDNSGKFEDGFVAAIDAITFE